MGTTDRASSLRDREYAVFVRVPDVACACLLLIVAFFGVACSESPGAEGGNSAAPPLELELRTLVDGHITVFGSIGAVVADDDGRIFVADTQSQEIAVIDADGTRATTFARSGNGPGEFGALRPALAWTGDGLVAADWRLSRITVFDGNGRVLGTSAWPSIELQSQVPTVLFAGGNTAYGVSRVQQPSTPVRWEDPPPEPPVPEFRYVRFGADGSMSILSLPTDLAPQPWPSNAGCGTADGRAIYPLSFPLADRGPLVAFLPDGEIAVASRDVWEINVYDVDSGTTVRQYTHEVDPLPLTDRHWEAQPEIQEIRSIERERGTLTGQGGTPCPILQNRPRLQPVIRTLISDEVGKLWVESTRLDGYTLTVLDSSGQVTGEAAMPSRDPRVAPYVRGDRLYIVTVDEYDVQSIEIHDVSFGSSVN